MRGTGREGERLAERYLARKGYRILDRGWTCRTGEIDLVAVQGDEVVFVEVKYRKGGGFGAPEESVTPAKQTRLRRAARTYLSVAGAEDARYRIDVVAIETSRGHTAVRHIEAAVGDEA